MSPAVKTRAAKLVATLGTEPQVVTATLDLLLAQGEPVSQVIVIHTFAPGTPVAQAVKELELAFTQPPYLDRVRLSMQPIIHPENGQPLHDVQTPDDTRAAFQAFYRQVHAAKSDGSRVHLSIAGGRKTLAVFGMATAQLLFDDDDRL